MPGPHTRHFAPTSLVAACHSWADLVCPSLSSSAAVDAADAVVPRIAGLRTTDPHLDRQPLVGSMMDFVAELPTLLVDIEV